MRKAGFIVLTAFIFTVLAAALPALSQAENAPRIRAKVTKALVGNPEVVIIDVRRTSDWEKSGAKIKGAVRESEKDISWAGKYPKDKFLILYCA
jgi:rhodanese-related sulfurtransferase